ncbi:unnamed protein product [Caretta caretta]
MTLRSWEWPAASTAAKRSRRIKHREEGLRFDDEGVVRSLNRPGFIDVEKEEARLEWSQATIVNCLFGEFGEKEKEGDGMAIAQGFTKMDRQRSEVDFLPLPAPPPRSKQNVVATNMEETRFQVIILIKRKRFGQ